MDPGTGALSAWPTPRQGCFFFNKIYDDGPQLGQAVPGINKSGDAPVAYIKSVAVEKACSWICAENDWSALWVSIWLGLGIFLESVAALECTVRYPRLLL